MAELATFIEARREPTGPGRDLLDRASPPTPSTRDIATEDTAPLLLRFDNGARGAVSISQISAGRKNSLQYEIDGSGAAVAWDSEQPDQLWIGHRERPNEILHPEPGAHEPGRPGRRGAARRPRRGLRRHVPRPLPGRLRRRRGRARPPPAPRYPTFADGHDEMLVGDAIAESARDGRWVDVVREPVPVDAAPDAGGRPMKLGLLTAPFPETPLDGGRRLDRRERLREPRDRLLAAHHRADAGATPARPTSTSPNLSAGEATDIADEIAAKGLTISGLGYYPNPLHPDPEHRAAGHRPPQAGHRRPPRRWTCRSSTRSWAATARRPRTTTGRRRSGSGPTSSRFAQDHGRKLTIENCPMLFSNDEWPGGHNLATTPRIWRRILEQWGGTIGLNFDPSHLVLQMIDIPRFIREFGPHILHMPGQGPDDRPRGPLRARHLLARDRLAGPAPARASARSTGPRSSRRCTAPATTATSSSSTRTATSKAPTSSSSAASCSPATSCARTSSERSMTLSIDDPDLPRRRQDDRPLAAAARARRRVRRGRLPAGRRVRRRLGLRPAGRRRPGARRSWPARTSRSGRPSASRTATT